MMMAENGLRVITAERQVGCVRCYSLREETVGGYLHTRCNLVIAQAGDHPSDRMDQLINNELTRPDEMLVHANGRTRSPLSSFHISTPSCPCMCVCVSFVSRELVIARCCEHPLVR